MVTISYEKVSAVDTYINFLRSNYSIMKKLPREFFALSMHTAAYCHVQYVLTRYNTIVPMDERNKIAQTLSDLVFFLSYNEHHTNEEINLIIDNRLTFIRNSLINITNASMGIVDELMSFRELIEQEMRGLKIY